MFKDWIKDLFNFGVEVSNDVTADIARTNCKKTHKEKKQCYINRVCQDIKLASKKGNRYILTHDLPNAIDTKEFIAEVREYFEHRGFHIEERVPIYGHMGTWFKISWTEGDE